LYRPPPLPPCPPGGLNPVYHNLVGIHVEQPCIPACLPQGDESDDEEYRVRHPRPWHDPNTTELGEFFALEGQHIENDEKQNRTQEAYSQSPFLDNGSQRGADKEHGDTGQGAGNNLVPLYPEDYQFGVVSLDFRVAGANEVF